MLRLFIYVPVLLVVLMVFFGDRLLDLGIKYNLSQSILNAKPDTYTTEVVPTVDLGEEEVINKTITFTLDNSYSLVGEVNEGMSNAFIEKILTYPGDELNIYIESPGGSVFAMGRMLEMMRSSKIKFNCIARFAASAAFMIFETCTNRYMVPDGVIMSHNASLFISGELPRVKSELAMWEKLVTRVEKRIAKRLKMSYEDYLKAINVNMWLNSEQALARFAADELVQVTCDKESTNATITKTIEECSFFGCKTVEQKFSGCPILTAPRYNKEDVK